VLIRKTGLEIVVEPAEVAASPDCPRKESPARESGAFAFLEL
jgi:hypothetical protein